MICALLPLNAKTAKIRKNFGTISQNVRALWEVLQKFNKISAKRTKNEVSF